jgi:WD40 repeat protein
LIALAQRNRAEEEQTLAFARELAAQSVTQQASDPELALLLGIEAVRHQVTPETEAALREALAGNHLQAVLPVAGRPLGSVELSPDGKTILVAGDDGEARLIDTSSHAQTETFRAGPPGETHAAFARRGNLVLTTNVHRGTRLWSAASGRLVRGLPDRQEYVTGGAISSKGLIATIVSDGVHLWSHNGKSRGVIGSPRDPIEDVAFSPDGTLLAIGDWLGVVRLRRLAAGTTSPKMRAGLGGIESLGFDPSGRAVLAAGENGAVQAWGVANGGSQTLLAQSSGTLYPPEPLAVAMTADGLLAVGNSDGTMVVKDLARRGRDFRTQTGGGAVADLGFSPDGRSIVTAQEDGSVRLFTVTTTDRLVATLGPDTAIQGVAFSRDGRFVAGTFPPELRTFGIDTSLLPRGTWVWRLSDRRVWKPSADRGDLRAAFSPDGGLLAIAGFGGTAIWPVFARRPASRFPAPSADTAFSPDGTLLAIAERSGEVTVRRLDDGRPVGVMPSDGARWARRVAFSPDGSTLLALGTDGVIRLWDREEGRVAGRIGNRRSHFAEAVFSPAGDAIAAISDTRLAIIDLGGGGTVRTAPVSSHRLRSVGFSPDGRNILVAGEDGRATVFGSGSLVSIADFVVNGETLSAAAFGDNGAFVALAGDGGVRVYRCDLCAAAPRLLAIAESTASRDLTPEERRRYLHE